MKVRHMKRIASSLGLCFVLMLPVLPAHAQMSLPLAFNGTDFTGWVLPEDNIWWSAGNGILSVQNGPDQKPSILWTEKEYANFVMSLEFRFGEGVVDSGVFIRKVAEQIQLGISGSMQRDMTASPYIEGKGYPVEAEGVGEVLKQDDWNIIVIVAVGQNYSTWLNGKKVMSYNSESAVEKGPIGLQLHANREMHIEFRNIALAELP